MLVSEAGRWCTRLFFIILEHHSMYAQMGVVEADSPKPLRVPQQDDN